MTSRIPLLVWLVTFVLVLVAAFITDRATPVALAQENETREAGSAGQSESDELLASELNTIQIAERYSNSVVSINLEVSGQRVDPFDGVPEESIPPFFRQFTPQEQPPQRGSGSGFVVSEDGRIITNFHVVASALEPGSTELLDGASLTVVFPTRQNAEVSARVIGGNALYDLALLELDDPDDLPDVVIPIPIGDSENIRVGQKTIAIGNPFGFESTVTTGIVSALGRNLPLTDAVIPLIQTDAAINPGNSGGPLLNSQGELIGINTAIFPQVGVTGQRGFLGIGFAVPSNLLQANLARLMEGGIEDISTRPRLGIGIRDVRDYPTAIRERFNLPANGVAVTVVEPGSAAEEAGLQGGQFILQFEGQQFPAPGDIITEVNGEPVETLGELQSMIFAMSEGDTADLTIFRDGEEMSVSVELRAVSPQNQEQQDDN
ncbi:MAG: trypsin-like peptidase domain-containing protein [Trueperaceae bacterium]